ncbi:AmmeMemoRadiSam system radical SAM enzyme [Desulfatiferula olefinivorans]
MPPVTRRRFIASGLCLPACLAWPGAFDLKAFTAGVLTSGAEDITGTVFRNDAPDELWAWSREAFSYTSLPGSRVRCDICPNACELSENDRSVCRSKVNKGGRLYTLVYGNPCAVHVDPVEKKPLYHFKPQTLAFSIGAAGCNFRCLNCQNWEISQAKPHEVQSRDLFPEAAVAEARASGCLSVAYTYSEASTFFEYMLDTARQARAQGLANLYISNGYLNPGPLNTLCTVLDAANINLKSFSDAVYRKLNGGRLEPVLATLKTLHERNVHLEITHLVVPGYTDDAETARRMVGWMLENLGPDHPLHITRFFPQYKLDRLAPTPVAVLSRFREIAMAEGLRYVYVGNVPGHDGSHTYCHGCNQRIIERNGYRIGDFRITDGRCAFCGTVIPGHWDA